MDQDSSPQAPQGQPQQEQHQQAPEQQEAPPELAPIDNGQAEGEEDGLEAAVRQLQREQAGEEGPGRRAEPQRDTKPKSEPTKDADGETEGEGSSRKPPVPSASQWASLNRREQEFVKKQQEFQQQKAELEAASQAIRKGKTSTWEALKALGFESKKEFLEHIADTGGEATPEQQEIYELKQWKQKQEQTAKQQAETAAQERKAEEYRQSVAAWHQDIGKYTKASEQWRDSLAALDGNEVKVFQVIQDHYQKEGTQLPYDDALKTVNEELESGLAKALSTIAGTARGRKIVQDIVNKSTPEGKRGKSVPAHSQGLTSSVRAPAVGERPKELSLDEALEQNVAWIRSQQRGAR